MAVSCEDVAEDATSVLRCCSWTWSGSDDWLIGCDDSTTSATSNDDGSFTGSNTLVAEVGCEDPFEAETGWFAELPTNVDCDELFPDASERHEPPTISATSPVHDDVEAGACEWSVTVD